MNLKYFFGFIAAVALIVATVFLVIRGFTGGSNKVDVSAVKLVNYANTEVAMQMTVEGPITADETHFGYRITATNTENKIETLKGYEGTVTDTKTYAANTESYAQFLRAIDLAGYSRGKKDPNKDSRGICANGQRFRFKIVSSAGDIQDYWTTSCGAGNFSGKRDAIRGLFAKQIPDFSKVTSKVSL